MKEAPNQKNISELKSYLGLKLLCKDVHRQWTDVEEAFQASKDLLTSDSLCLCISTQHSARLLHAWWLRTPHWVSFTLFCLQPNTTTLSWKEKHLKHRVADEDVEKPAESDDFPEILIDSCTDAQSSFVAHI